MNSSLLAIRAIAAEFAHRIFVPVVITIGIISVVLIVVMVWLLTISAWWLLLAIPLFVVIFVGGLVLAIVGIGIRFVNPGTTKAQKKTVSSFVDKIQRLSDVTQTPKIILLFRAIRDVARPSKGGFVQSVITDSTSLQKDFRDVIDSFSR